MLSPEDFCINLHPSGAVYIKPDPSGAVTCVVRGVVEPNGVVVSMITRPGEVTITLASPDSRTWVHTLRFSDQPGSAAPVDSRQPLVPAKRRRGRPPKLPLPPAAPGLTLGALMGEPS